MSVEEDPSTKIKQNIPHTCVKNESGEVVCGVEAGTAHRKATFVGTSFYLSPELL